MLVTELQATEPLFPYYELIYSFHLKSEWKNSSTRKQVAFWINCLRVFANTEGVMPGERRVADDNRRLSRNVNSPHTLSTHPHAVLSL